MISAMWVIYVKAEVAKCSVVGWTRIVPKGQSVTPNERNAEVKATLKTYRPKALLRMKPRIILEDKCFYALWFL